MFFLFAAGKLLTQNVQAFFTFAILLLFLILLLIVTVVRIKGWFREDDDPAIINGQMLQQIAELQRRGEITGEEYRSIKGRLIEQHQQREKSTETSSEDRQA